MEYINNSSFLDCESNKAKISGTILEIPSFSHEMYGERFYQFKISSKRTSGTEDIIKLIVSEHLLTNEFVSGKRIFVNGELRTYNYHDSPNDKSKLLIYIYIKQYNFINDNQEDDYNEIILEGTICKEPLYRRTPIGKEISDIIVAVNRNYNKSDYIPCICWGRTAREASRLEIGSFVKCNGRIQSRQYRKQLSDNEFENRIAYEVSLFSLLFNI